MTDCNL